VEDQKENFYWVGGTHAGGSRESWSVGEDGAVPIYVELRPLSDLLAPPFFTDPVIVRDTRAGLRAAIDDYMKDRAKSRAIGGVNTPRAFDLRLSSIEIEDAGDDIDRVIELFVDMQIDPGLGATVHPRYEKPLLDAAKEAWLSTVRLNTYPYHSDRSTTIATKRFIVNPARVASGGMEIRFNDILESELRDGLSGDDDELSVPVPETLFWRHAGGEQAEIRMVADHRNGTTVIFRFTFNEVFPDDLLELSMPDFNPEAGEEG
jgi:hypothetical protein